MGNLIAVGPRIPEWQSQPILEVISVLVNMVHILVDCTPIPPRGFRIFRSSGGIASGLDVSGTGHTVVRP